MNSPMVIIIEEHLSKKEGIQNEMSLLVEHF